MAPNAKIDGDYWVFVHVLEPDGEQLWVDDHLPPTPTSTWKPGQKVEYTRTVFVPNYPYIGPAVVRLGLYDPKTQRRLTLGGDPAATRKEYQVAKFELQPQSENIFLIFKEGWHPNEVVGNDPNTEWQWTKKSATDLVPQSEEGRDGVSRVLGADRQVHPAAAGHPADRRSADRHVRRDLTDRTLVTFPVTAAQFGTGDVAELVIDVDRTFTPGGSDTRELGIQVFHAFVDAK